MFYTATVNFAGSIRSIRNRRRASRVQLLPLRSAPAKYTFQVTYGEINTAGIERGGARGAASKRIAQSLEEQARLHPIILRQLPWKATEG